MNEIMVIQGVQARINKDGVVELNLEHVARGLGFTQRQTKNGKEYESIRWERIIAYLDEFCFPPQVGEDGTPEFIPENIFYKLCFKAKNETARAFQDLVTDEILPSIRKHGVYATDKVIDKILANPDYGIRLLSELKSEREQRKALQVQANNLQQQLDESKNWFTIKRVAAINNINWRDFDWRKLKHQSIIMGKQIQKIFDANFGEVNLYHIDVFKAVYPGLIYG